MENEAYDGTGDGSNKILPSKNNKVAPEKEPEAEEEKNIDDEKKHADGNGTVIKMEMEEVEKEKLPAEKPYADMGKEDLLRFSETIFWSRLRLASILIFWATWLALLGAVIGLTIVAPRCDKPPVPHWWQKSVIYQIYVRSFFDSDGDGVGDLHGITAKLDYIENLGVDTILLSSIFKSDPGNVADYGYQVLNHTEVNPAYDSGQDLAAFQRLLDETHKRGLSIVLDFIPNYTSKDHIWFEGSRKSTSYDNPPYWNYYIWANCSGPDSPPNNWASVYGQPAWTYDDEKGQCYLHQFLESQPELNLRSTSVRKELEDILRFWLEKGVDGFRVNVAGFLFESQDLLNEPELCPPASSGNPYDCLRHNYTLSQPEVYEMITRWRAIVDDYSTHDKPRILITDGDVEIKEAMNYYGTYGRGGGANLPINYQLTKFNTTECTTTNFTNICVKGLVFKWLDNLPHGSTADWLTGDQDRSRLASFVGPDFVNVFTMLKMTLPGAAFVYYGEEIGMINGPQGPPFHDPAGVIRLDMNRDGFRTPMQWTNETTFGGFVNGSINNPWIPIPDNENPWNVQAQTEDDDSFLNKIRIICQLRKDEKSLQFGALHRIHDDRVFGFVREHEGFNRILVVANFDKIEHNNVDLTKKGLSGIKIKNKAELVFSTDDSIKGDKNDELDLRKIHLKSGSGFIVSWDYQRP